MNLEVKDILPLIKQSAKSIQRYLPIILIVGLCSVYILFVYRINSLAQADPEESALTEKLLEVKRPKIDESAIDTMLRLEERSVEVKSIFEQARENPFAE